MTDRNKQSFIHLSFHCGCKPLFKFDGIANSAEPCAVYLSCGWQAGFAFNRSTYRLPALSSCWFILQTFWFCTIHHPYRRLGEVCNFVLTAIKRLSVSDSNERCRIHLSFHCGYKPLFKFDGIANSAEPCAIYLSCGWQAGFAFNRSTYRLLVLSYISFCRFYLRGFILQTFRFYTVHHSCRRLGEVCNFV